MRKKTKKFEGFSLIELIVSITIMSILVVSILSLFNLALKVPSENRFRIGAITIAEEKMEIIKNLPYNKIGTIGGIPSGSIPQTEVVTANETNFTVSTQIQFVDDYFDGTVTTTPQDLLNTDYKRVRISVSWVGKFGTKSVTSVSTVAPKGIESTEGGGTLLIKVFDAGGIAVPQADVTIVNNLVTPPINIFSHTNDQGILIYPGATSTVNGYQITATKSGYSTDRTCAINAAGTNCTLGMPNPVKPHATVITGQLTEIGFPIDILSTLNIRTLSQSVPTDWTVNTDANSFNQDTPALAQCPNGDYIFVWRDYQQNDNPRIYAQRFNSSRVAQWTPDLAITTSNNQANPDVAVDQNCNIYVAWGDDRNGNQDIYFQKFDSNGTDVWTGAKKLDVAVQSADQTNPQVIMNASSTNAYIVWADNRNDANDIYAQKIDTSGNRVWSPEIKINNDTGTAAQSLPRIDRDPVMIDGIEKLYFVWHDNRNGNNDVFAQAYNSNGTKLWTNDLLISFDANASDQINSALVRGSDNFLYFVWQDNRNANYDIYALKFDLLENAQWGSSSKLINSDTGTATQEFPVIAQDSSGNLYIVWQDDREGNRNIYMQKIDNLGNKLINFDTRINSNTAGNQEDPDIIVNQNGNLVITWQDNSGGDYDIAAGVYGSDPQTVTNVPNVSLRITGSKKYGDNGAGTNYYKFDSNFTTDASGNLTVSAFEWDPAVTIISSSHTIISSNPSVPFSVNPNSTVSIILNVQ